MFQTPQSPRFSVNRLTVSFALHATALILAVSVRFSTPVPAVRATPARSITILAPSRPLPETPRPPRPAPIRKLRKSTPRTFAVPAFTRQPRVLQIDAALPDQAPPPPLTAEPRAITTLPPPPIVLGKLTQATAAAAPPAPARASRASTFGAPALSPEPDPARATKPSGFASASVSTEPQRRTGTATSATAVEILSKPRPLYTDEARRLRIEGEVLLEVLFSAAGTAHVERILKGLGYGLDESAAIAAAAIQFRPAQRAGQPVDQSAIVHITFQLAY